jgi:polyphosphate kinase
VYFFENGGRNEVYIGSSDWMPRNLDRRVEVLTPVQEPAIRRHLREDYLEAYLRDNVKAREMQPDGSHIRAEKTGEPFNAQLSFQEASNVVAFGG